ncbi:MAG: histone-like nucleoid-structuring protein, MvaT/MvaU family [Oleiphilaceae bacterium]|nr:histone-like nucleoid-structuring protein, MvaT/MvaU family [Oleiphilaceae bacterium]
MVNISDYYKKKKMADQLARELQQMEENTELKKEFEFKEKLRDLMTQYGKSGKETLEVLSAIDPAVKSAGGSAAASGDGRRKRPLKTYRNPHTGETVQTRGGNHKVLNAWREQYGREEVASWQQD